MEPSTAPCPASCGLRCLRVWSRAPSTAGCFCTLQHPGSALQRMAIRAQARAFAQTEIPATQEPHHALSPAGRTWPPAACTLLQWGPLGCGGELGSGFVGQCIGSFRFTAKPLGFSPVGRPLTGPPHPPPVCTSACITLARVFPCCLAPPRAATAQAAPLRAHARHALSGPEYPGAKPCHLPSCACRFRVCPLQHLSTPVPTNPTRA